MTDEPIDSPARPALVEAGLVEAGPVEAGPAERPSTGLEAAGAEAPDAPAEPQLPGTLREAYDALDPVAPTGDPRVDDAAARLAELGDLPVEEHLEVYQDVHRRLHAALADLDVS